MTRGIASQGGDLASCGDPAEEARPARRPSIVQKARGGGHEDSHEGTAIVQKRPAIGGPSCTPF